MNKINKWGIYELELQGPRDGNPFVDVDIIGEFIYKNRKIVSRGFYDGDGVYKIRFMPDKEGVWEVKTVSNIDDLNGKIDTFNCIEAKENSHGPVRVSEGVHFSYEDGKPFYPFGTTAYVWNYQPEEVQKRTIESLKKSPFNKIRMCVFPKYYDYNTKDPEIYPYVGHSVYEPHDKFEESRWSIKQNGFDFTKFNPKFFDILENQIRTLDDLGIEVDLILFHPYDQWGFSGMGKENDLRYLRYIVARLASFKNIWWSLANEYDLLAATNQKSLDDWDDLFKCIKEEDPYNHLASIHNWHHPPLHFMNNAHWYDHSKPWVDHLCIQHDNMFFFPTWLRQYRKPLINDECRYEGNLNHGWGNMTAKDKVKQFWEAVCHGGYAGHGETYFNEDGTIWWSHGGTLKGESVPRIGFLRNILEENQYRLSPIGEESSHWETAMSISNNGDVLIYLGGSSQASYKVFHILPEGCKYEGELIDTWNMTIEEISGLIDNTTKIELPSKPYMALRLKLIK